MVSESKRGSKRLVEIPAFSILHPMYFTYIIYSATINRYYVGFTNNLSERLKRHNAKHKGFSNQASDWMVIYYESFNSKAMAMAREKQIKSWKSRQKIEELVKNFKS